MLFNNDSIFVVGSLMFIAVGLLTSYSYYINTTNAGMTESVVNTPGSPVVNAPGLADLTTQYVEANVQTDANINVAGAADASVQTATTYVNSGMQTSARMWLESVRNWIDGLLSRTSNSQVGGQYVDVGVQTNTISVWDTVKQWFLEVCCVRPSELSSMGYNKVSKWRNKLDSVQSVDVHNSESPLTKITFHDPNDSTLDRLVDPDDSASQISEVVSEANLQNVETANRVYDMSNSADVLDLMNDPTVVFSVNPATLPGDDLITFYTADSTNEILRSTLEALLNSVN